MNIEQLEARVNEGMTKAGGSLPHAAILLNWTQRRLVQKLKENPHLHHWLHETPPSDGDVLNRRPLKIPGGEVDASTPDLMPDEQVAIALVDQDGEFKASLKDVGFDLERLDHILALRNIARKHFKATVELFHGGMVRNFVDCGLEKEKWLEHLHNLLKKLKDEGAYPLGSAARQAVFLEARQTGEMIRLCGQEIIKSNEVAYRGMLAVAMYRRNKGIGEQQSRLGYSIAKGETIDRGTDSASK